MQFALFVWFLFLGRKKTIILHWPLLIVPSKSVIELSLSLWLETLSSTIRFVSGLAREQGVGRMLLNIARSFLPLNGQRRGDVVRPFTLKVFF